MSSSGAVPSVQNRRLNLLRESLSYAQVTAGVGAGSAAEAGAARAEADDAGVDLVVTGAVRSRFSRAIPRINDSGELQYSYTSPSQYAMDGSFIVQRFTRQKNVKDSQAEPLSTMYQEVNTNDSSDTESSGNESDGGQFDGDEEQRYIIDFDDSIYLQRFMMINYGDKRTTSSKSTSLFNIDIYTSYIGHIIISLLLLLLLSSSSSSSYPQHDIIITIIASSIIF